MNLQSGGIRLFKVFGITVFLHWSWFLVAVYEIQWRQNDYSSRLWMAAEYLSLFAIVLTHEFGHALACRSVGGQAERIILWPLGGAAFVSPPSRPGAMLWSIVAGPLVNVLLLPILYMLVRVSPPGTDLRQYLYSVEVINIVLLVFNIMPIYPLDGGKILWALLWFAIGFARALMAATIIGLIGASALLVLAICFKDSWIILMAAYMMFRAWTGLQQGIRINRLDKLPRHPDFACPNCQYHPIAAPLAACTACKTRFDVYPNLGVCPGCGRTYRNTVCPQCRATTAIVSWQIPMARPAVPQNLAAGQN